MGADERAKRDALAWEIGDALGTMNGKWDGESHKSAGFHRRVAYLMPEMLVREALTSTRDALEQRRAGRGGLRSDPAAFFAGAAKELAKQNGIDLGLRPSKSPAPALSQVVPGTVLEGLPVEEEHVSPERVREYIGQILAKLPKSSNEA